LGLAPERRAERSSVVVIETEPVDVHNLFRMPLANDNEIFSQHQPAQNVSRDDAAIFAGAVRGYEDTTGEQFAPWAGEPGNPAPMREPSTPVGRVRGRFERRQTERSIGTLMLLAAVVGAGTEDQYRLLEEWRAEMAVIQSRWERCRWLVSLLLGLPMMRRAQREPVRELR